MSRNGRRGLERGGELHVAWWHESTHTTKERRSYAHDTQREIVLFLTPNAPSSIPSFAAEIYIVGNKIDLIEYRRVTDRDHNKFIDSEASIIGGFFVSASSGENVLTTFYLVSAKTVGIELSDYELAFTKKVLGVEKRGGDEEGVMKGSEQIQQQDEAAHEDVLNMLKGGGGGSKGGCDCCIS